ncbi:MAG: hypothetical protein JO000_11620, partial [Alphaproteobacteria bacterium]|nr:hypothetical protein [Alphaproteobacteria bacterium]
MRTMLCVLAACAACSSAAAAQQLTMVEVNAPAVNCVFRTTCIVPVSDSTGTILLPTVPAGTAWLQSRTFQSDGAAPAGAGVTGYEYRISLTQAAGVTDCMTGFTVNFGPHKPLPYKNNQLADVYIITTGGIGTIKLAGAQRFGDVIQFTLSKPLCIAGPANGANTTFFIGLAATTAPMHHIADVAVAGQVPIYGVDARVPTHTVPPEPG